MINFIIIAIVIFLVCLGIVPIVNHFKGYGGCCGRSSYKPKKKILEHVIARKIFFVEGMHCENCCHRVVKIINEIQGLSAKAYLKKGIVKISYANYIDDSVIIKKIENAGYTVKSEVVY